MGARAIYCLAGGNTRAYFYAHNGANALSPLLRLAQALEIREELPGGQSVAHIFEHLDYNGKYQPERLGDADMFFWCIPSKEVAAYWDNYNSKGSLEMWVTLDLDRNLCTLEYNPNCPCYRTMGTFSIDIDVGLENVRQLLEYGEGHGITDFGRLLAIYHNSTGLGEHLEAARGSMRIQELLDSSWAKEARQRYWTMAGRQEVLEEQGGTDAAQEEMEER